MTNIIIIIIKCIYKAQDRLGGLQMR